MVDEAEKDEERDGEEEAEGCGEAGAAMVGPPNVLESVLLFQEGKFGGERCILSRMLMQHVSGLSKGYQQG